VELEPAHQAVRVVRQDDCDARVGSPPPLVHERLQDAGLPRRQGPNRRSAGLMSNRRDRERLRANEFVFHYFRGNFREAAEVELSGPAIKPADVVAAIQGQLADERLVLLPMKPQPETETDRVRS
jgi:hypothetical protein